MVLPVYIFILSYLAVISRNAPKWEESVKLCQGILADISEHRISPKV
jgi:hypothetical protein